METKIRLGISECLLGHNVRYDGGHKRDRYLTDTLGKFVEFVPVCPEVEAGLGVPREAMQLCGDPDHPCLMTVETEMDLTERMQEWARRRVNELDKEDLRGFVFKSNSPSCGVRGITVYDAQGVPSPTGGGIFARTFMERFPLIPVEEEGCLHDPHILKKFMERISAGCR